MDDSKIEWTDDTVNPWWGCTKISDGCKHCYAETFDARGLVDGGGHWGSGAPRFLRVAKAKAELDRAARKAVKAGKPRRVFIASMADIFEERDDLIAPRLELWEHLHKLAATRLPDGRPALVPLILTKRPAHMARWAAEHGWPEGAMAGTSVEDQATAEERIPELLKVPAQRFLSMEPFLGAVDLGSWIGNYDCRSGPACQWRGFSWDRVDGFDDSSGEGPACPQCESVYHCGPVEGWEAPQSRRDEYPEYWGIHWVIVGGESGPKARPMHPAWVCSIRDQCVEAGVPFLFKQWGAWISVTPDEFQRVGKKAAGRLLDGRAWDELPEGCR